MEKEVTELWVIMVPNFYWFLFFVVYMERETYSLLIQYWQLSCADEADYQSAPWLGRGMSHSNH